MGKNNDQDEKEIIIRLKKIKESINKIIDTEYRFALLIVLRRLDYCMENLSLEKLQGLELIIEDLMWVSDAKIEGEETIDYIYSELNEIIASFKK